jgi:hypothetical protein
LGDGVSPCGWLLDAWHKRQLHGVKTAAVQGVSQRVRRISAQAPRTDGEVLHNRGFHTILVHVARQI